MSVEGKQFQKGDPSGYRERPEDLWRAIAASVRQSLEVLLDSAHLKESGYGESEIAEEKERALRREELFFLKVLSKIQEVVRHQPNTIALFDVDETLGKAHFLDNNTMVTVLRPSVLPLFERLRSMHVDIGFFTSRGEGALRAQLDDEKHLKPIREYIRPELVFSSSEMYSGDSLEFKKRLKDDFGGDDGIIDDAILGATAPNDYPALGGDQTKLQRLKQIRSEIKDKAIVVVDDYLGYTKFLNAKKELYGVQITEEMFSI